MKSLSKRLLSVFVAASVLFAASSLLYGQAIENVWTNGAGNNDWGPDPATSSNNWSVGFPPFEDEWALINLAGEDRAIFNAGESTGLGGEGDWNLPFIRIGQGEGEVGELDIIGGSLGPGDGAGVPTLALNGAFGLDLSAAGTALGNSWSPVDENNLSEVTLGESFRVAGFVEVEEGVWGTNANGVGYRLTEATLTLEVVEEFEDIWVSTDHPFSTAQETVRDTQTIGDAENRFLRVSVAQQ